MKPGSQGRNFESEYKPLIKISIMKKNLLLGFLVLFLFSTTAFAALADTKKEADKPAIANTRENKLSEEELSRMNKRAETENISKETLWIYYLFLHVCSYGLIPLQTIYFLVYWQLPVYQLLSSYQSKLQMRWY